MQGERIERLNREARGGLPAEGAAGAGADRWRGALILLAAAVALFALAGVVPALDTFPESWNLGLRGPLNEFKRWVVVNRNSHPLFTGFFEPLSAAIDFSLRRVEAFLIGLPWPVVIAATFGLALRLSGLRLAGLVSGCLLLMGLFGLWTESMETLALMSTAVLFTLLVGIPCGIWTARSDRAAAVLRPVLDAMQTMPAFVYLIPVLLFFGVARVPSVIATVIYALPPIIRLTNLGIRNVPHETVEAARAFGTSDGQLLRKVQLPLAMPSILTGVNQTIMMALSIVVIAALIGAGGLGDVVLKSLRRLNVGAALEAGLAIVLMAILLDRLSRAAGERWQTGVRPASRLGGEVAAESQRLGWLRHPLAVLIGLALLALILRVLGIVTFPRAWNVGLSEPVDALVAWMQVNLYQIGNTGLGTGPLRDFLILNVFRPLSAFFTAWLPWTVVVLVFGAAAWAAGGWLLAAGVSTGMILIGLLGMWPFAMDTLSQTVVAVLICVALGVPLGIWAARSDRVDGVLQPVNDLLQTIPIFVYLVPVIMLFGSGSVAGLIASVLYAIPPVVRLTSLGIRGIDPTVLESARSFGSTGWQRLLGVEIPLALPTIMLGINQTILMVLAMVIIAGLVGATGLGLEVVQGFANDNLGRSVEAGLAIVLLAITIDRITQAAMERTTQK